MADTDPAADKAWWLAAMAQLTTTRVARANGVAVAAAAALALLAALKFLYLLIEAQFNLAQAPIVFVLPVILLAVGAILAKRGSPAGLWMIGATSLILLAVFIRAVMRVGTAQQNWADTVLVFAGIPLALAAVFSVVSALRRR